MSKLLQQALRSLCLPLSPREEPKAETVLKEFFEENNVADFECLSRIKLELGLWEDSGKPSKLLSQTVGIVLASTKDSSYPVSAKAYFSIHRKLQEEYKYSHSDATAFLSHLRIAIELAINHRFSAARLTYVLSQLDGRIHFSSQNIGMALQQIGYTTGVSVQEMETLFELDRSGEVDLFADADLTVGAELVALNAAELGFRGDLKADLLNLAAKPDETRYIAHLQVLHFQCSLLDFYDHSAFDLYEFRPRGATANWLFDQYPRNLATAANPFLNNAKAVGILNRSWVESKGNLLPGALALFNILSSLDELSYAERREVAKQIRAWIFLFLRLSGNTPISLPSGISIEALPSFLIRLSSGNTQTLGILEQRLVDAITGFRFQLPYWRARGLSDSINATNLSKKKLGDCDYQNSETREIEAFESHGGKLTDTYIEEHIRTLRKVLPLRVEELDSIANISEWKAKITFVAQSVNCDPPKEMILDGLRVQFKILTFSEFIGTVDVELIGPFISLLFLRPLGEKRTPEAVRLRLLDMLVS